MGRKILWYGIYSGRCANTDPEDLKDYMTPYKENSFIRNLVNGYAARFPGKVNMLKNISIHPLKIFTA